VVGAVIYFHQDLSGRLRQGGPTKWWNSLHLFLLETTMILWTLVRKRSFGSVKVDLLLLTVTKKKKNSTGTEEQTITNGY
jgi:hypothetical protein